MQTSNPIRSSDDVPTSVILPVVSDYFRAVPLQVTLERVRRDCDKYRGLADKPDEAGG